MCQVVLYFFAHIPHPDSDFLALFFIKIDRIRQITALFFWAGKKTMALAKWLFNPNPGPRGMKPARVISCVLDYKPVSRNTY
jgi:hypothetical protein